MTTDTDVSHNNIVNGINVDDVKALVASVAQDAGNGQTSWRVSTEWQGQTRSRTSVGGYKLAGDEIARSFTIDIDEPCQLGGANLAANPQEYLLAALNACMTVGYVVQCAMRGIELERLAIETEGDIDLRGFLGLDPAIACGYENVRYIVRIKGDATHEQFAEIHDTVTATSPNFYNFANAILMKSTLSVE